MKYFIKRSLLLAVLFNIASLVQAEVVVIASSKSVIGDLTPEQVKAIYLNKLKELPNGAGVPLPMMLPSSPSRDEFLSKVLKKSEAQAKAYWAKLIFTGEGSAPTQISNAAELKTTVEANPAAMGFIEKNDLDDSVKVILTP
jgi:ABC-type phosphate transport system substrate-binding protein